MTFSADDLDEPNARQIEKAGRATCSHENAEYAGECAYGCCLMFACPDCHESEYVGNPR